MPYGPFTEEYRFIPQIRIPGGGSITLRSLQDALKNECAANGLPVAFRNDELRSGGLLSRQRDDVLVLYHPNHENDYLKFILRVKHQGNYAFLDVYKVGESKNFAHDNAAARGRPGQKLFNSLSGHNAKIEEEDNYYTILEDCIKNLFTLA